jgi:hypothetical protein
LCQRERLAPSWSGDRATCVVATTHNQRLCSDCGKARNDADQLPASDRTLEKELKVNVRENLQDGVALRAGFNSSGVSRNSRFEFTKWRPGRSA